VIPKDKDVNALNKQISAQVADYMAANPDAIKRCLHLLVVSKSLERIADHAKNVAEEVVYLCEAQDIRHSKEAKAAVK
jgi:phosphate transport system protein